MADNLITVDRSTTPARIGYSDRFNVAVPFIDRHVAEGRGGHPAIVGAFGTVTYGALADRVNRCGNALKRLGLTPGARVLMMVKDCPEFFYLFWGAIKAGFVPVPLNTLLRAPDYAYMIEDSGCAAVVYSPEFAGEVEPALASAGARPAHVLKTEGAGGLAALIDAASADLEPVPAAAADDCFWLYSSGSTGRPKGVVHAHRDIPATCVHYAAGVLGIDETDICFSAAKLFFAYGLGNGLTFPMSVGATAVLLPARPTPADVFGVLKKFQPTIFYGVPTLFAALVADPARPNREELNLRVCASAGEALPAEIGRRWTAQYGCDVLDGIGSTEMLHIFLSNRPGEVRYGTTGKAVPGYELRIVGDDGRECGDGEIGELQISGPSAAIMYWNNRAKTKATFAGEWTRSGDKYTRDADGYYTYGGRSDDMLKVGGIYVSPFEVEACLMTHAAVLEAAVIGAADSDELVKPKAYVVLKPGQAASAEDLQMHVKSQLAPYKYPRWIQFVPELPKTATGKIQRFKLRGAGGDGPPRA